MGVWGRQARDVVNRVFHQKGDWGGIDPAPNDNIRSAARARSKIRPTSPEAGESTARCLTPAAKW